MTLPVFARVVMTAVLLVPTVACGQAPVGASPTLEKTRGDPGAMSFQQFETRRMARMMAMDTDGDGRIGRAEFMAASASGKGDPTRRFARLDANGDGFVDRGEIDAMLRRRFDRIDADHDGIATPAERAAAHKRKAKPDDNG